MDYKKGGNFRKGGWVGGSRKGGVWPPLPTMHILLICYLSLKESTCEDRKTIYFISKASFCSQENQILEF